MVNEPETKGYTPLFWAAYKGHQDVIKWWIVSGREMHLGTPGDLWTDAIGAAKQEKKTEVVSLLERFKSDSAKTRSEVRKQLGITGSDHFLLLYFFQMNFNFPFSRHQISLCPPHQSSPGNSTSPSLAVNPLRRFCLLNPQLPLLLPWSLLLPLPNRSCNLPSRLVQPRKRRMPSSPPSLPRKTPFQV